jgi:hypothetical protein
MDFDIEILVDAFEDMAAVLLPSADQSAGVHPWRRHHKDPQ